MINFKNGIDRYLFNQSCYRDIVLIVLFAAFSLMCTAQQISSKYTILSDSEVLNLLKKRGNSVRYSEFHIHTGMKNSNNYIPSPGWLRAHLNDNNLKSLNWDGSVSDQNDKFNNFKSYRQADWGILSQSQASILASAISPLEKHMLSKMWPLSPLPISARFINSKVSGLSKSRLKTIYSKQNSSFSEFNSELQFLSIQNNSSPNYPGFRISFAADKNDLIQKYLKRETVLVLSLEGGHIFHGNKISAARSYDHKVFKKTEIDEILRNVDSVKNLPYRAFFIALGHFSWNGIVGFAKTLDMDNDLRKWLRKFSVSRKFRTKLFLSYGQGIIGHVQDEKTKGDVSSNDPSYCICQKEKSKMETGNVGWRVIEKLLDTSGRYRSPIYIDVKHMDVRGRLDYYNYLKSKKLKIPIIASHVGVSGKDTSLALYTSQCPVFDVYEEVENPDSYYSRQFEGNAYRKACLDSQKVNVNQLKWFYPWGINLATEEIPIIYDSDGIIGLALEERVIGTGRPNYASYIRKVDDYLNKYDTTNAVDRSVFHAMLPFFKNLFFVVNHSGRSDSTAWDHISLGSDYDGIAKPLSFCKTAAEIPKFHGLLIQYLPWFVKIEYNDSKIPLRGLSAEQISNKIVFENGEKFFLKYF